MIKTRKKTERSHHVKSKIVFLNDAIKSLLVKLREKKWIVKTIRYSIVGGIGIGSFLLTIQMVFLIMKPKQNRNLTEKKVNIYEQERKITFSGNESLLTIDPALVKEYIDTEDKTIVIIDTRSAIEYAQSHIKFAHNAPLYTDFRRPYESLIAYNKWIDSVKQLSKGKKTVVMYGYKPDADMIVMAVQKLKKQYIPARILSVSFADWQGSFWQWIPGGELNSIFNINDYLERQNK